MSDFRHLRLSRDRLLAFLLLAPVLGAAPGRAADDAPSSLNPQSVGVYGTVAVGALWPQSRQAHEPGVTPEYSFTDRFSPGVATEVGLGYDFGAARVELTYAYDQSQLSSYSDPTGRVAYRGGQQGTNSLLLSAYWDIDTKSRWTPYLGGGVGYGWQNQANSRDELGGRYNGFSVTAFAWQAKAGMSYSLSRSGDLYGEFVYRGLGGFSASDGPSTYNYSSYNRLGFQVGTRWRF